jgi:hypothetical protein
MGIGPEGGMLDKNKEEEARLTKLRPDWLG